MGAETAECAMGGMTSNTVRAPPTALEATLTHTHIDNACTLLLTSSQSRAALSLLPHLAPLPDDSEDSQPHSHSAPRPTQYDCSVDDPPLPPRP